MAKLLDFRVEQATDRRGYIYFDLIAVFSDGQKLLSMSHETRLDALIALGVAVERARNGLKIQSKRKGLLKAFNKQATRTLSSQIEETNNTEVTPPTYPMGVRLVRTARS